MEQEKDQETKAEAKPAKQKVVISQSDIFKAFRKQLNTKEYRDAHPFDLSLAAQGMDPDRMTIAESKK